LAWNHPIERSPESIQATDQGKTGALDHESSWVEIEGFTEEVRGRMPWIVIQPI